MTDLVIPQGQLLRSRVVPDLGTVLRDALDRRLTGYAIVEPQPQKQGDDAKGFLTFEAGIPFLAYYTGTDAGGKRALSELTPGGPCRLDLYVLSSDQLEAVHDTPELRVPPEMPANCLVGDPQLAARTRKRAAARQQRESTRSETPQTGRDEAPFDAVEAFLEDTERIEAIREQARAEAKRRANEWELADQLE